MLDGEERHGVGAKDGFKRGLDLSEYAGPGGVVGLDINFHFRGRKYLFLYIQAYKWKGRST